MVTYKGFVEILNLKTGETRSVNMSKTANKATKDNSTKLSKWRVKNPNLPLTASEYITIEKITKYRVRTVQPQKEDKTTFASRWKRTKNDTSDIRSFIIANNEKEEYKTKNNEKVRRLLKIVTA